jgi:translation initiation factor IF-3
MIMVIGPTKKKAEARAEQRRARSTTPGSAEGEVAPAEQAGEQTTETTETAAAE